ncbi:MAG: EAL domain-containing protein [Gammaproteobacteria bacterium]|nr:EAL domain-containing protein [Gammaproteobacteria bacterium]
MNNNYQLLENVDACVFIINFKLDIEYANKAARAKFCQDRKYLSLLDLLQEKDRKFFQTKFMTHFAKDGELHKVDYVIPDGSGKLVNVSISLSPWEGDSEEIDYIVTIKINYQLDHEYVDSSGVEFKYLKAIFDNTNDAIFLSPISKDGVHGNFIKVNKEACERLGYTESELLQLNARTINPDANMDKIRAFGEKLKKEGSAIFEAIHEAKDGSRIPVEVNASVVNIDDQNYVLSIVKDQRAYKKVQTSDSLFGRLLNHSWNELYVFNSDSLNLVLANQGAQDNLGYTEKELLGSKFIDYLKDMDEEQFRKLTTALFNGDSSQLIFEATLVRKNQTEYPVEIRLQLSHSEVPPVYLANVQDITERKKTQERLNTLANYDMLTGLPNRALFVDRLDVAMKHAARNETLLALLFIDLDGFKQVNDTLGHDVGDELLVEIATRLKSVVRETDTVARLGGDEFTVILTNIQKLDATEIVLDKIMKVVNKPVRLKGKDSYVSPSIGVAIYPISDVNDKYELLRQADMAMYQAKKAGKNNYKYFSSSLFIEETRTRELAEGLKQAMHNGELITYFQPRVDLRTNTIVCAEVLLRWISEKFGFVSPEEFIPIMESTGLIHEVGLWVIKQSCEALQKLTQAFPAFRLSINVSAIQFEDNLFVEKLQAVLQEYEISAYHVELEITEGLLISHSRSIVEKLDELKAMGIIVSLDDFGTGYSSLSYIKQFPIDVLKVDKSFVMDMDVNQDSLAIVRAIVGLAKSLNVSVTAEGIEKPIHLDMLREMECDEGQGFYLAKPMPFEEFNDLIVIK